MVSTIIFEGVAAGSWRFEVQGQDAAGNAAAQNLLADWNVEMDAGEQYARIMAGPFGPTANRTAQFTLLVRRPQQQKDLRFLTSCKSHCCTLESLKPDHCCNSALGRW